MYRRAPHPNGTSPSELMLAYPMKANLDLCIPRRGEERVPEQLWTESKEHAGKEEKRPRLKKVDKVAVRNFGRGPKWWLGEVEETNGTSMVTVSTPQGKVRHHNNQVKSHLAAPASSDCVYTCKHRGKPRSQHPKHSGGYNSATHETFNSNYSQASMLQLTLRKECCVCACVVRVPVDGAIAPSA